MSSSDIIQIIVALSGAIVLVMNTYFTYQTKSKVEILKEDTEKTAEDQNEKLNVIHDNGNAHLAKVTQELAASNKKNEELLNSATARSEALMIDANRHIEELVAAAAKRFEDLERKLEYSERNVVDLSKQIVSDKDIAQRDLEPIEVEVKQPQDNPVPVKLPPKS